MSIEFNRQHDFDPGCRHRGPDSGCPDTNEKGVTGIGCASSAFVIDQKSRVGVPGIGPPSLGRDKFLLEDNDIECVIINKKDRSYGFGEFELYCMRDYVIRAKLLLKEL